MATSRRPYHRLWRRHGGRGLRVRLGLGALGGRKAHARRRPRAVEQALAQLIYVNFDLHGETSYQAIATEQTAHPK